MYPLKFRPILKSILWGGERIVPFKQIDSPQTNVGESWELSGVKGNESIVANGELEGVSLPALIEKYGADLLGKKNLERFGSEFPLLVKFIDAKDDLSIQVHPNDELADARHSSKGKTEMWYVVDAAPDARLRAGFAQSVTAEEYEKSVEEDTITDLLKEYELKGGECFFLPAGRIHSIGAGSFIAEIQQTSDITYRIYDFNRRDAEGNLRELHTELAKDAIEFEVLPDYRTHYENKKNQRTELVNCPYFTTAIYDLDSVHTVDVSDLDSFVIVVCVEGQGSIKDAQGNEVPVHQGETVLLPATNGSIEFTPDSQLKFLLSYVE